MNTLSSHYTLEILSHSDHNHMRLGYEDQLASGIILPRLLAQLTFHKLSAELVPHSTSIALPNPMEVAMFGVADTRQDPELIMPEQSSHPTVRDLSHFTVLQGKRLIDAGFSTLSGDVRDNLNENEQAALDDIRRALTSHLEPSDEKPSPSTGMYL